MSEVICGGCGLVSPFHGIGCPNDPDGKGAALVMDKCECSPEQWLAQHQITQAYLGTLRLPPSWVKLPPYPPGHPLQGMVTFVKGTRRDGLTVIADCSVGVWEERHDRRWLHVSVSRRDRVPNYQELTEVKAIFIGEAHQALMIFPRKARHINIHPNCLHLWCCLEGDGLPDFGAAGTI